MVGAQRFPQLPPRFVHCGSGRIGQVLGLRREVTVVATFGWVTVRWRVQQGQIRRSVGVDPIRARAGRSGLSNLPYPIHRDTFDEAGLPDHSCEGAFGFEAPREGFDGSTGLPAHFEVLPPRYLTSSTS
ncbi:hypothetical protein RHA1_ro11222 (plasmid) [Rhodococcus jostii RHA1]|uniref:Uncharacterized protein n=1 Tax=Rhodococcus jostii (strain RHA1) TaxID=101510 RepID=Q0RV17_RHOJR|nr:hypothetical protein RHA1_ro11222 [Rhodococcus jostii RHA1]